MRAAGLIAVALALGLAAPATAAAPATLSGLGTAHVTGIQEPGEWDHAAAFQFSTVPPSVPKTGTLYVMNDDTNLYLGVKVAQTAFSPGDSMWFEFDNDHDGVVHEEGDDALNVFGAPPFQFTDGFVTKLPPCAQGGGGYCVIRDTELGGQQNSSALATNDGTTSFFEFSRPLNTDDDAHDMSLTAVGQAVGFQLDVSLCGAPATCVAARVPGNPFVYDDIVVAAVPSKVTVAPASGTFGSDEVELSAALTLGTTSPAGKDIALSVNGEQVGSGATDQDGKLVFDFASLEGIHPGVYPEGIKATFTGTGISADATATAPLTVTKATQKITFAKLPGRKLGSADFRLSARSSSGLPVKFGARGRCRVSGRTVHLLAAGTCTVTATQPGSIDYTSAPKVVRTFAIAPRPARHR